MEVTYGVSNAHSIFAHSRLCSHIGHILFPLWLLQKAVGGFFLLRTTLTTQTAVHKKTTTLLHIESL